MMKTKFEIAFKSFFEDNLPFLSTALIHYKNPKVKHGIYKDHRIIFAKSKEDAAEKLLKYWKDRTTLERSYLIQEYNITETIF